MPLKWQRKKEAKKESFARFVFKFVLVSFSRLYTDARNEASGVTHQQGVRNRPIQRGSCLPIRRHREEDVQVLSQTVMRRMQEEHNLKQITRYTYRKQNMIYLCPKERDILCSK